MKLILTGASGFIGHNVLLRAPRDWEIVAVYGDTPGLDAFVAAHGLANVRTVRCNLLDEGERAGAGPRGGRTRGRHALPGGQRRSGRVGRASAVGPRVQHRRVRDLPRALSGRSRRLRVVWRRLRRVAGAGVAGDGGVAAPAVRHLQAGVGAVPAVLRGAPGEGRELRQRALLRRLRPVRGAAQDHDEVAAGHGRPASASSSCGATART